MPVSVVVELQDPASCVDADALANELDLRGVANVTFVASVTSTGDVYVVTGRIQKAGRVLEVPAASVKRVDCPDAPAAIASKVRFRLEESGWCVESQGPEAACSGPPALFEGVDVPIGMSVGLGEPWDVRGELSARAVLRSERFRVLLGGEGSFSSAFSVGQGSARMAETVALAGVAGDLDSGLRFEGGAAGGLVVGWGESGLSGAQVAPTVFAWAGASLPVTGWLRAGLGARVYGVRLGLCDQFGPAGRDASCPSSDLVSEPWVRVEARLVPLLRSRRTIPGGE